MPRPSTVTGADYNQLSTSFFQNVNKVLTGGESAPNAVSPVEKVDKRIVRKSSPRIWKWMFDDVYRVVNILLTIFHIIPEKIAYLARLRRQPSRL